MRGVLISVLVAVTLGVSPYTGGAFADEAYVCEGGRVAYVRFGELEAMKRKDPCIAAYYGAGADDGAAGLEPGDAEPVLDEAAEAPGTLPLVRTAGTNASVAARPNAGPVLKVQPRLVAPQRQIGPRLVAASGPTSGVAQRAVAPPMAHPETDFRNVRVINAPPGENAVFRHVR